MKKFWTDELCGPTPSAAFFPGLVIPKGLQFKVFTCFLLFEKTSGKFDTLGSLYTPRFRSSSSFHLGHETSSLFFAGAVCPLQ